MYGKLFAALERRLKQAVVKIAYSIVKYGGLAFARRNPSRSSVNIYPALCGNSDWRFHSETWSRVIHRWEDRAAYQDGRPVLRDDSVQEPAGRLTWQSSQDLSVEVPSGKKDRWVYAYLDPSSVSLGDFVWSFKVTRRSDFQELQFGFRYVDFYNRYRIRQEAGRICYDIVRNGVFYNNLASRPLVMELGRSYDFKIQVVGKRFWLYVDGDIILKGYDALNLFPRGSVAFILWESKSAPSISALVRGIRIEAG